MTNNQDDLSDELLLTDSEIAQITQRVLGDELPELNDYNWTVSDVEREIAKAQHLKDKSYYEQKIKDERERLGELLKEEIFNFLRNQPIPKIAVENPQPHKWATELIGHYDQKIQPWWFGEGETKGTCLWLKNLPPLIATYIHPGRIPRVHHEPPGENQKANRARTYQGIAKAMAEQWG